MKIKYRVFTYLLLIGLLSSCQLSKRKIEKFENKIQGKWVLEKTFIPHKNGIKASNPQNLFSFDSIKFEDDNYLLYTNKKGEILTEKGEFDINADKQVCLTKRQVINFSYDSLFLNKQCFSFIRLSNNEIRFKLDFKVKRDGIKKSITNTPFAQPDPNKIPNSIPLVGVFKKSK